MRFDENFAKDKSLGLTANGFQNTWYTININLV
jgi:hypothetical protein